MGLFDKLLNKSKKTVHDNNMQSANPKTKPKTSNYPSQPSHPGSSNVASSIVDNEEEFERQIAEIIKLETESFKLPTFVAESFYQLDGSESGIFEVIVQLIQQSEDSSHIQLAKENIVDGSSAPYEATEQGVTLLHIAVIHNRNDFANFFLEKGANLNAEDLIGRSPAHYAAAANNADFLGKMNESWAMPRNDEGYSIWSILIDKYGYTPLHYAVENVAVKSVTQLLAFGINVMAQDERGQTALHLAVQQVDSAECPPVQLCCIHRIIEMLLKSSYENESNSTLKIWEIEDANGFTAEELARNRGFNETAEFIEMFLQQINPVVPTAPDMTRTIYDRIMGNCDTPASSSLLKTRRNECGVCYYNEIDILLEPCNHLVICSTCVIPIKTCPICRADIKSHRKVFFS